MIVLTPWGCCEDYMNMCVTHLEHLAWNPFPPLLLGELLFILQNTDEAQAASGPCQSARRSTLENPGLKSRTRVPKEAERSLCPLPHAHAAEGESAGQGPSQSAHECTSTHSQARVQ